ncbi:DUF2635 domain-containing protein [Grimontia marina]|uniref:DUF2635 domain-containing protein n=1 Tax=Grimontia marina TaxID=646534 RepID=A0A128FAR6_9GAMM|nr:DUF2635 domain-containing protein [Grimontia marina]CZF83872.1 hypothetical protein GMA8713_02843 [Grimontia marina]
MNTVTLYPTDKKVKVRKPDGGHLNENGEPVVMTAFWHRRVRDGSVTQDAPEDAINTAKDNIDTAKDSAKPKGSK